MKNYLECQGQTVDDCLDCGLYHVSHSPHYDDRYGKKVITIWCSYGHSAEYDEETRMTVKTYSK